VEVGIEPGTLALNAASKSTRGKMLSLINEVNMAKRRNPKKEKALRNQAYARKFRKRTTTGRFQRKNQQRQQKSEEEDEGAAAAP
jgi:hypothetical protein